MPRLLDRYVLKQVAGISILIALTLAGLMMMTQSLRFLELVIDSGASGLAFITLSLLALPRFFEVILPIALAAGTMFVYLRLRQDGEIAVMQSAGMTPSMIARPGFMASLWVFAALFVIMSWLAPMTLSNMIQLRQVIKAQYSGLMFREGVFNSVGGDITVYVARRGSGGTLQGLMVYDARAENPLPVTIMAREGRLVLTNEGQRVVVYNGTRQVFNPKTGAAERLNFEQYVIDLPDSGPIAKRWSEPEERTLPELLWPSQKDTQDIEKAQEFQAEMHRRFISPFLAPCFFMVTICLLLLSPFGRTRSAWEIVPTAIILLLIQSLYIGAFSFAKNHMAGVILMYALVLVPLLTAVYFIERASNMRPIKKEQDKTEVPA